MKKTQAEILFTPDSSELRFLPEGPYRAADGKLSWVAIQHGADAKVGSLNFLDLASGENRSVALPGRPGFAFPTSKANHYIIGMEREVLLFDTTNGSEETLAEGVDVPVDNTIINDGMVYGEYLIFGCKDLEFATKKAGLYLLKPDHTLIQLANDQICSNGKFIKKEDDGSIRLYDICSAAKQIVSHVIDFDAGELRDTKVVVDLTSEDVAPDGMIMTPDEKSLIVAIFNPGDATQGEARQYNLASGEQEAVWICDQSPRVTCPQLVEHDGKVKLVLTTADEGMAPELRAKNANAGCLFIADTEFTSLCDNPIYPVLT